MSAIQTRYFVVMIDIEQSDAISFYKLSSVIKEMQEVDSECLSGGQIALAKVHKYMTHTGLSLKAVFETHDEDGKKFLMRDELVAALRDLMPAISMKELRLIIAMLYRRDVRVPACSRLRPAS